MVQIPKGKLIVIDGADGTGKKTQTKLLVAALRNLGYQVEETDFPRYYKNFAGSLIGKFQSDPELNFSKLNPWLASLPYAIDRFEEKEVMERWLFAGTHVISDRYVSANQLHQGGKIKDDEKRKEFLQDLDHLEHGIFKIPRPDLIILLDLPVGISLKLMQNSNAGEKKRYSNNQQDLVEQDTLYQINARASGIKMLSNNSWVKVECSDDGKTILSESEIHHRILDHVLKLLRS